MGSLNKRTRALQIPRHVKEAVAERDSWDGWPCCIICGSPEGLPEAHYIPRSQGGLGIEENIVTLCRRCHGLYDQSEERANLKAQIREYLQFQYEDWDENKLYYRRDL